MNLDKFINLLAAIFGTCGGIYVMHSIMVMSPELMVEQAKTYWGVYRSRFLGHGYSHIRPDLWVATVGDRRSSAKCVRRILRATPQDASGFRRSPSSCGLRPGQQVSTHLRR